MSVVPTIQADLIRIRINLSYTIFRTAFLNPPKNIGDSGDLFIREHDNRLFYKVPERIEFKFTTLRHHIFPSCWRPVPTNPVHKIYHPDRRYYYLIGKVTQPAWVGLRKDNECSLSSATLMYTHLKNKEQNQASSEL